MFVEDEIAFVKSQIEHHSRSIEHFAKRGDVDKVKRHRGILKRFQDILPKMEQVINGLNPLQPPPANSAKIGARFGDISDIPEELRAQLVSLQYDQLEQQIIDVVNKHFSNVASIDEILVALWREHGDLHQRDAIANKIYRMTRKEQLYSVHGRKGVYSTSASAAGDASDPEIDTGADQ